MPSNSDNWEYVLTPSDMFEYRRVEEKLCCINCSAEQKHGLLELDAKNGDNG